MSSRSLAAARARRSGDNIPPVSGNRPGTSINSHAAFVPQHSPNVRVARGQPPQMMQQQPQPQKQQHNAYQQVQQSQQQTQNGLPFNKLSVADAIGLITLRLGRCEQWIIETEHDTEENSSVKGSYGIPENSRVIDNSVITNIVSRLDSLEKRENIAGPNNDEVVSKLGEEVSRMNTHLAKIVEESSKHSLITAKHSEQLLRFERELVETKDILKTFMLKYDTFTSETSEKLGDFEFAISELEKQILPPEDPSANENGETSDIGDRDILDQELDQEGKEVGGQENILSVDLKNIIQQEFASVNI